MRDTRAPLLMKPDSVSVHQLSWKVTLTVRKVPSELLVKKGEAWFEGEWKRT